MNLGDRAWTIAHHNWGRAFGHIEKVEPWQGSIVSIQRGTYQLAAAASDGSRLASTEPFQCADVAEGELFETEAQAWEAFIVELQLRQRLLSDKLELAQAQRARSCGKKLCSIEPTFNGYSVLEHAVPTKVYTASGRIEQAQEAPRTVFETEKDRLTAESWAAANGYTEAI